MKKLFAPLVFVLVLFGCTNVPAPQTPKQALVVAEYTFQGALHTVIELAEVGTLTAADAPTVLGYIGEAEAAIDAARAAVASGAPNASSLLGIAQQLTGRLVLYLDSKRGKLS